MNPGAIPRPRLVGVVNITEDSFSDGGRYLTAADAVAHARRLRLDGADVIELGPAASHPGARPVTAAAEQQRLAPVVAALADEDIPVAVDSYRAATHRWALTAPVGYLNDIQGFPDPREYAALAAAQCRLIVMHSVQRSGPATQVKTDPERIWAGLIDFFAGRLAALQAAGVARDRLIIDPGLGFFLGSNPEPSLAVLARLGELRAQFGVPVLISPSRKSFLRTLTGRDVDRVGPATLAAELWAAGHGADYVRTHDVGAVRDALAVLSAIAGYSDLAD
jgi:dihydropteroate synthase type 2